MGCINGTDTNQRTEVTVTKPLNRDATILKIKLQRDKIIQKRNGLNINITKTLTKAKLCAKQKRKQEAIYYLSKNKQYKKNLTNVDGKLTFLEKQINNIEEAQDDIEFTKTIKNSNDLMKNLMKDLDYTAIREAKELDEQVNLNNREVMDLINENKDDPDILAAFENLGKEEDFVVENNKIDYHNDNNLKKIETQNDNRQVMFN